MRPDHAADDVMRVFHRRHPVSHRLVDRVTQRPRTAFHGADGCPEQSHAEHVRLLTTNVLGTHVNRTRQPKVCARGGCRDAVLARTGFCDHSRFAHSQRQQRLADRVVNLVSTGVVQVFSLEPNLGPAD